MDGEEDQFPYQIRDLTTDDLDQYNALLRYAFQVTEKQLMEAGWRDDEIMQSKFPILERADVLGSYDGDNLISQIAVYPLQMNIHDEIYPIGYVTSVNTYPEYSGRGIIRVLMHRSLARITRSRTRSRTAKSSHAGREPRMATSEGWTGTTPIS